MVHLLLAEKNIHPTITSQYCHCIKFVIEIVYKIQISGLIHMELYEAQI